MTSFNKQILLLGFQLTSFRWMKKQNVFKNNNKKFWYKNCTHNLFVWIYTKVWNINFRLKKYPIQKINETMKPLQEKMPANILVWTFVKRAMKLSFDQIF